MRALNTLLVISCLFLFVSAEEDKGLFSDLVDFLKTLNPMTEIIKAIVDKPRLERLGRDLTRVSDSVKTLVDAKQKLIVKIASGDLTSLKYSDKDFRKIKLHLTNSSNAFNKLYSDLPAEFKTPQNPFAEKLNDLMSTKEIAINDLMNAAKTQKLSKDEILQKAKDLKAIGTEIEKKVNELIVQLDERIKKM